MNSLHDHNPSIDPPAQHRGQLSSMRIGVGLFGAPLAWLTQFSLSEPLAAYACYPNQAPLSEPVWTELPVTLAAISIACLAIALISGFIAWTSWRRFAYKPTGEEGSVDEPDKTQHQFLIKLSLMSSFIFTVAIMFNICAILLVSPCSPWL
jgi:hypothetical protein